MSRQWELVVFIKSTQNEISSTVKHQPPEILQTTGILAFVPPLGPCSGQGVICARADLLSPSLCSHFNTHSSPLQPWQQSTGHGMENPKQSHSATPQTLDRGTQAASLCQDPLLHKRTPLQDTGCIKYWIANYLLKELNVQVKPFRFYLGEPHRDYTRKTCNFKLSSPAVLRSAMHIYHGQEKFSHEVLKTLNFSHII